MTGCAKRERSRTQAGIASAELLVAAAVGLVVLAAAASLVWDQLDAAATQPEVADLQQRARLAEGLLRGAFSSAGAWVDHGAPLLPAACCMPAVQPRRIGTRSPDPPGTARADVLTLVRARPGAARAGVDTLAGGWLTLLNDAWCPPSHPSCGLRKDDHVLVSDRSGRHDFLRVETVSGFSASVSPRQPAVPAPYGAGAVVAVETSTYTFDATRRQLRLYDGFESDMPVVDDVVALRFEYFGETGVPARARTDGEGCWFDAAGVPRLGRTETPPGSPLIRLELREFDDGPWCGDGDNRFDADLLRIRLVRAVVRLQASADTVRGRSAAFHSPGRADSGRRFVPDLEVVIDGSIRVFGGD